MGRPYYIRILPLVYMRTHSCSIVGARRVVPLQTLISFVAIRGP